VQVPAIGPVEPAAKISIVSFGIDGARRSSGPVYAGSAHRKRYANMACHGGGNFILNAQDIANVAGVRIGPQMRLVAHLNELDINPDLIAASTDTAFEGVLHVQCVADIGNRFAGHEL